MLLAIDTSNDYAGIALRDERGLLGEAGWHAGRQHTEQVLPQIDLLFRHLHISPADLHVIAVAVGPGSWSGLRAGMSLAKALAVGRRLPIIGIPTLDALAQSQRGRPGPVVGLIRLGRDRFGAAVYTTDERVERTTPFLTVSAEAAARLAERPLLIGDIPSDFESGTGRLAAAVDLQRRAPWVAELAWERHKAGQYDDLVALEPIYLASPVRSPEVGDNDRGGPRGNP
jgi:tRNA threonylcarbamoyladenosine biosynthesis protein TsaB